MQSSTTNAGYFIEDELWKQEIQTDSYYGFEFPIDSKS